MLAELLQVLANPVDQFWRPIDARFQSEAKQFAPVVVELRGRAAELQRRSAQVIAEIGMVLGEGDSGWGQHDLHERMRVGVIRPSLAFTASTLAAALGGGTVFRARRMRETRKWRYCSRRESTASTYQRPADTETRIGRIARSLSPRGDR